MKIYLDTEFTDFRDSKLISIGLISGNGEHSFYAELTDSFVKEDCSYFVLETILPLLDAPALPEKINYRAIYARMTTDECRQHLDVWFANLQEPAMIITDSSFDHAFLRALFNGFPWPTLVDPDPHYISIGECEWIRYSGLTDRNFEKHPNFRRHHALDDARVMQMVDFEIRSKGY